MQHTHIKSSYHKIGPKPNASKINPKLTIYMVGTNTHITQTQITYETCNKIAQSKQGSKHVN